MKKVFLALACLSLTACYEENVSDKQQREQQERLSVESNTQVGMPGVNGFTEKRMVRMLYELRDKKVATFTYAMDLQGRLWHVCDSIGYGLPYGVQFSNPEKHVHNSSDRDYNIPQAEPNGLFMPPTAEGTWVMCAGDHDGAIDPIYVEPRVIVSPHKLNAAGSWTAK